MKFIFKDGSAETTLTVKPKPAPAKTPTGPVTYVPNTEDQGDSGMRAGLLFLSLIILAGLLAYRRSFTE